MSRALNVIFSACDSLEMDASIVLAGHAVRVTNKASAALPYALLRPQLLMATCTFYLLSHVGKQAVKCAPHFPAYSRSTTTSFVLLQLLPTSSLHLTLATASRSHASKILMTDYC